MAAIFCHFLPDDVSGLVSMSQGLVEYLFPSLQSSPQSILFNYDKSTSLSPSSSIVSANHNGQLDDPPLNHFSIDIMVDLYPNEESNSSPYAKRFFSSLESIQAPFSLIKTSSFISNPLNFTLIKTKFRHWYFTKVGTKSEL